LTALILGIWKPWGAAYAGEKGKNLARKEDLETVLAEVRAVTITQKEIEQKISGDLWDRQVIWNQKRDMYAQIIKSGYDLSAAYNWVSIAMKSKNEAKAAALRSHADQQVTEWLTKANEVLGEQTKAFALARIFGSPGCIAALEAYVRQGDVRSSV
jgi:hypothetical protein